LAQKTQESTQNIETVIEKLQQASRQAVSAMDESQKTANAIVEVNNNIETISQMSELIASAAEEQSALTQDADKYPRTQ
jgi:methyl-accepting chemotaxis protein